MLKAYRKRFVLSNLLLVGVALLLALTALGVLLCRNSVHEVRNTMRMVIAPWNTVGDTLREHHHPRANRSGNGKRGKVPRRLQEDKRAEESKHIITAIYFSDSDEVALLSSDGTDDSAVLEDAVRSAAAQKKAFGALSGSTWIYYRENGLDDCRVSLAPRSYLRDKLAGTCLALFAFWLGALALVLLVSIWLSKLAAKPMEDAMRMERQFIADVSHDLKTPIAVVLADCSVLKSNTDTDAAEHALWIESIEIAAKKMMTMVEQMLTLSTLEAKGRTIEKSPILLSAITERILLELDNLAFERNVTIESNISENLRILATEEYAERIVSSLLENAIKYEPDGGSVELRLTAERKKVILSVHNRGSVIAPEDLPHIFERFYRGDKARTGQNGYGLGLPILKQIVDLLGAQIRVSSSAENGTVFTVIFDCAEGKV